MNTKRYFLILALLVLPRLANAQTSANAQNFLPAVGPSSYFSVLSSRTMPQWGFHVGAVTNYGRQPVMVGATPVIDDLLMTDVVASISFTDWLELGVDAPVILSNDSASLSLLTASSTNFARSKTRGIGDIRVQPKFRILNYKDYEVGVAFSPVVTIPIRNGDDFAGDNQISGGGVFVIDGEFLERAELSFNFGFILRHGFTFPGTNTERDDYIPLGIGLSIRALDWIDVVGEVTSSLLAKAPFDRAAETPLEGGAGIRFRIPSVPGFSSYLGGSAGMTGGYGSPRPRVIFGMSYSHLQEEDAPPKKKRVTAKPVPTPVVAAEPKSDPVVELTNREIKISRKIHFEYGKANVRAISADLLRSIAKVLREHPELRKVEVGGHTDSKGSEIFNQKLSQKRAEAVRNILLQEGIEPGRIVAKGYGESEPRVTNETEEGRARNRRVQFRVLVRERIPQKVQRPTSQGDPGVSP